MNPKLSFPRIGSSLFIIVLASSLSLISCGGAGTTTTSGAPAPTAPGGTAGSPPPPPGGNPPSGNAQGTVLADLQQKNGWTGYALLPPVFAICPTCSANGPEATWAMTQGISSPAMSGNSTKFDIGGQTKFADILWNNHLIGDFSSQDLADSGKTLAPTLHNFVYDVYFYGTNIPTSQAVEFDINQFVNGKSFIWGHECRIAGGHEWDTWDNAKEQWVPSGIACNPKNNDWNHLVIEVQRTSDDRLLFQSITLNDQKSVVNRYDNPTPRTGWYGVTINYQQDGNRDQAPYSIWLDKMNFSYW